MNLLALMGKDTTELLSMAGEALLKEGCESFVLYKDDAGKFQQKQLKFNIVEKYEKLLAMTQELVAKNKELSRNAGHSE